MAVKQETLGSPASTDKKHAPSPPQDEIYPKLLKIPEGKLASPGTRRYSCETVDGQYWEVVVLPHEPIPKLLPRYDYRRVLQDLFGRQNNGYITKSEQNISYGIMPPHEESHFKAEAFFDTYFASIYPLMNPHHNGTVFPRNIGFREVGVSKSQVDHVGIWRDGIVTVAEIAKKPEGKQVGKRNNVKNNQIKKHIEGIRELFLPGERVMLIPVIARYNFNGKSSLEIQVGGPIITI